MIANMMDLLLPRTYCGDQMVTFPGICVSPIVKPSGGVLRGRDKPAGGCRRRASLITPLSKSRVCKYWFDSPRSLVSKVLSSSRILGIRLGFLASSKKMLVNVEAVVSLSVVSSCQNLDVGYEELSNSGLTCLPQ